MTARLFDPGPADVDTLTPMQARALRAVLEAGRDGITAAELGASLWSGAFAARKSWALAALKALRAKGLVRQRRGGVWQAVNAKPAAMTDEIPY